MAAILPQQEERFLELLLADQNSEGKKNAFQRLCKFARSGIIPRNPHSFRQTANGALHSENPKVRRWALNTIALIGRPSDNLQPVLEAIDRDRNDPEIVAAAVAALAHLQGVERVAELLASRQLPLEGSVLLASAQHIEDHRLLLAQRRVNIERATLPDLKLATVLVGVGKAPENLFSLNHSNRVIITDLNGHNDPLVAQYSVWAIVEMACCRFGGHRDRVFHLIGERECREGSSAASSSLRR